MSFSIRFAKEDDVPTILQFITSLAKYEKLEHEVVATEDLLRETLFGEDKRRLSWHLKMIRP